MRKHGWVLESSDRKFPKKHQCPTCRLPLRAWPLQEQGECVCVWEVRLKKEKKQRAGEGHAAGQAAAPDWPIAVKTSSPPLTVGLVTHAQDDLRGAVVACDYIRCHKEAGGGGPGQTKIQDL